MKKNQKTSGSFNGISSQAGIHDKEAVADQYDQIFNSIQKNIIKNEKPSIAQHMGFLLIQSDEQLLNKMHKIFGDEFSALIRKNEVENAALYMVQNDRSLKILKYLIDTLELNYLFEVRNKWDDNLLSIACEYRAKETALYLIEKGFYKSENGAINRVNETPLHGAARSGMLDVIKKLIEKYKAEESGIIFNKNTQAGDNFMHILNIFNHGDIYKELINKKAFLSNKQFTQLKNLQNKHGYACTQSELMLKKLKYSQREYSKPDIKIENLSQAISCFYKAMFSDRDERLLEEAVNKLHQEINDRRDLVLQARNKNISEADLLIIQFLIHNCIRVAIYDVNKNENILKYIEILCNLGNFHNIKFELFVSLAQTHSLIDNNIEKIIKYSKLAEAVYTEFPDIDYKMDIVTFFFNFGIFCLKYDFYQSLKERDVTYICNNELNMQKDGYNYIEKALNLIKKDKDLKIKRDHIAILKKIYKIYSEDERGNLEKLIEVAHLIPDQKLSNLYILSALLNMTDAPSSILFNAFGFPDNYKNYAQEYPVIFYTICAEARLREGKIEKALEILNQAIASADTNRYRFFDEELDVLIVKTMHLYLHSENYEGGYQLLQKIYLKFPEVIYGASANHQIKLYEAIIFENQGLTHKVNELLKNPTLKMLFFSNILNKVCVLVLDNKYQEAYNNLVRLNDISTNKESVFISKYMNRLESLLTECGSANTDPKNTGSSPSEDSIHQINDEEEFNNALSSLSGRQIHDWFQKQKSQFFSNKKDDYSYLIGKAKGHSWVIGDKLYSIAGSDIFNSKEHLASLGNLSPEIKDKMLQKSCAEIYIIGINYYAAISPKISAVLSDELSKKFIKAMEGGMVKNSSNSAGIKMIGHNLIELKICGQGADQRLYTDHIYKNSALESLIVFDYSGNHAKLSSACSASNLKIVDVPCIYDDLIGLVGGDNISLLGDVPSVL